MKNGLAGSYKRGRRWCIGGLGILASVIVLLVACASCPCEKSNKGACCWTNGVCVLTNQEACGGYNLWHGVGSVCLTNSLFCNRCATNKFELVFSGVGGCCAQTRIYSWFPVVHTSYGCSGIWCDVGNLLNAKCSDGSEEVWYNSMVYFYVSNLDGEVLVWAMKWCNWADLDIFCGRGVITGLVPCVISNEFICGTTGLRCTGQSEQYMWMGGGQCTITQVP